MRRIPSGPSFEVSLNFCSSPGFRPSPSPSRRPKVDSADTSMLFGTRNRCQPQNLHCKFQAREIHDKRFEPKLGSNTSLNLGRFLTTYYCAVQIRAIIRVCKLIRRFLRSLYSVRSGFQRIVRRLHFCILIQEGRLRSVSALNLVARVHPNVGAISNCAYKDIPRVIARKRV